MNVQIQRLIVTRKRVDVFVHRIAKVSIVNIVCPIHTGGNIKKDVNCAIVITLDRLDNRVICIRDNVCAVKDSQVKNVIDVQLATTDIRIVNAAIAIVMVRWLSILPNRLGAMITVNVHAKHW